MPDLSTDVRYVKGIGEARAKSLQKLGIFTLGDLIAHFPRAYDDRREARRIADLQPGETACVRAMVAAEPTLSRIRRGLELVKLRAVDESGAMEITFFNQGYMKQNLHPGESYTFYGRAERQGRRTTMANPVVEREEARELTGRIVPIYPLTAGVSQTMMLRAVAQGLTACRDILEDPLPQEIREEHHLCHVGYAYDQIHFPAGEEELDVARRRLVFEELFILSLGLQHLRRRREVLHREPFACTDMTDFKAALPFALTGAQARAIEEIMADLAAPKPMNRLVQGDVGSGKTMVAAAALLAAARSGFQGALMAPTELLAEQHFRGLAPLLEKLGVTCVLLTGSTGAKARRQVLEGLRDGSAQVAIGTHALISGDVEYRSLGLVVTDEQHRFGVDQRAALSAKGEAPHLLVMSATPIPRTLALMIYGDLDVSIIDELPPGRQKIDTFAVPSSYHQRMYGFIRKEVEAGRQGYIICTMVEESDAVPDERKTVVDYAEKLKKEVFPDLRVGYVHGRMKPREKEKAMAAFAAGEMDLLVSTTVVEVGVDVPNATIMVVEDADRFGLSQLHQLRGRVGRGQHKSYCILVSDNRGEEARTRLKAMTKTNDGFKIAEEDLKLRGPGDFFGQRQHGLPALKVADLSCDMHLLREAQAAAEELLRRDPELNDHPATARRIVRMFEKRADAMN